MDLYEKILVLLLRKKEVEIESLASNFNESHESVSKIIGKYPEVIGSKKSLVYLKNEKASNLFIKNINITYGELISNLTIEERRSLILIKLLTDSSYISLYEISIEIGVSKNTALNDINILKAVLDKQNINLDYNRKNGYFIVGDEIRLRKKLIETVILLLGLPIGKLILEKMNYIKLDEVELLKKKLEKVEHEYSIAFSDESIEILPFVLLMVINRIRAFKIDVSLLEKIDSDFKNSKEYISVLSIFWNYNFLNENDVNYLLSLILSANTIGSKKELINIIENDSLTFLTKSIDTIIQHLENKLAIIFIDRNKLKQKLIQHLIPAIYRNILGIKINNPITTQFIHEYKSIFEIVKLELTRIEEYAGNTFSNDEIAFVAMIVLSHMISHSHWVEKKTFSAIVVCQSGTSVSNLVKEQLKELLPQMEFTRTLSLRQYETEEIVEDFVFSTIPIEGAIKVSSIISKEDKEKIVVDVEKMIEENSWRKTQLIISYLNDYIEKDKKSDAFHHLHRLFNQTTKIENNVEKNLLVSSDQITLHENNIKWEDIVEIAFEPMLMRETITDNYVQATVESFNQYYSSQIIGPGVLLPHSTPNAGVNYPDVQINIFKKPIKSPDNNNYHIVIALAPSEKQEHLQWLLQINNKFRNQKFRNLIIEENDIELIFDLLQ